MKSLNRQVNALGESIFSTITQLANAHHAINLSQGFPDFDGPAWVIELAKNALEEGAKGKNQYAPSYGILPLREAIATQYETNYGLHLDPKKDILITNGATEAIYATIQALVNPADEVVVFEPLYDSYAAAISITGGVLRPVTLKLPDFQFDLDELQSVINDKTKLLILNSPHNPTGKVFSKSELELIAGLALKHDFFILCDEVYEYLTFDVPHIPIATIPEIRNRVITISSIGKTYSLTGWKIGWACASQSITRAIHNVHQFMCFCVAHPLQEAIAKALPQQEKYLPDFRSQYDARRSLLIQGLSKVGFNILPSQGTYFILTKVPDLKNDIDYCQELILTKKVATIPTSAFYVKSDEGSRLIRFCFAKKEETLRKAIANLSSYQGATYEPSL